jgi:hypothetical protein
MGSFAATKKFLLPTNSPRGVVLRGLMSLLHGLPKPVQVIHVQMF